jgi:hypothetical protein
VFPNLVTWLRARRRARQTVRYPGFQDYPKVLYHHKHAPTGRTFESAEHATGFTPLRGWVESPDDMSRTPEKLKNALRPLIDPELPRKTTTGVVIALITSAVLGLVALVFNRSEPTHSVAPPASASAPETIKAREPELPASQDRVFAACGYDPMPSVVPPTGEIFVLRTNEIPQGKGGGGLDRRTDKPGLEWKWSNDVSGLHIGEWAYLCKFTNYTDRPLFNVALPVRLTFREPVPARTPNHETSRQRGEVRLERGAVTLEREWLVTIPKLDPAPGEPYVFYIWNCCAQRFVEVAFPLMMIADGGEKIQLVQPEGNLAVPLFPPGPF